MISSQNSYTLQRTSSFSSISIVPRSRGSLIACITSLRNFNKYYMPTDEKSKSIMGTFIFRTPFWILWPAPKYCPIPKYVAARKLRFHMFQGRTLMFKMIEYFIMHNFKSFKEKNSFISVKLQFIFFFLKNPFVFLT